MRKQQQSSVQAGKGMFDVMMVTTKSVEDLDSLGRLWSRPSWRCVKELGTVVHRATLRVDVTSDPATRCQEVAAHQVCTYTCHYIRSGWHQYGGMCSLGSFLIRRSVAIYLVVSVVDTRRRGIYPLHGCAPNQNMVNR